MCAEEGALQHVQVHRTVLGQAGRGAQAKVDQVLCGGEMRHVPVMITTSVPSVSRMMLEVVRSPWTMSLLCILPYPW